MIPLDYWNRYVKGATFEQIKKKINLYVCLFELVSPQVLKSTTAVTAVRATATTGAQIIHGFLLPHCAEAPKQQSQDKADDYGLNRQQ